MPSPTRAAGIPAGLQTNLRALLGVIHLRRGEMENCLECVGPSSCIFPIAPEAVHQQPSGSREADPATSPRTSGSGPTTCGVRWLLNIAYMTLGEYPEKVPPELPDPARRRSARRLDVGRFENVAPLVGLGVRGPNLAGGSIFDDFNGDGLPDLFTTSLDVDLGALAVRQSRRRHVRGPLGRGRARRRRSTRSNLHPRRLRQRRRPGRPAPPRRLGERPPRLSLLRNKGDGVFEDVTVASGPGRADRLASRPPGATTTTTAGSTCSSAASTHVSPPRRSPATAPSSLADPRNHCRLYHNRGDGTFVNVAEQAGVSQRPLRQGIGLGRLRRRRPARPVRLELRPGDPALPQRRRRHLRATSPPSWA